GRPRPQRRAWGPRLRGEQLAVAVVELEPALVWRLLTDEQCDGSLHPALVDDSLAVDETNQFHGLTVDAAAEVTAPAAEVGPGQRARRLGRWRTGGPPAAAGAAFGHPAAVFELARPVGVRPGAALGVLEVDRQRSPAAAPSLLEHSDGLGAGPVRVAAAGCSGCRRGSRLPGACRPGD